MHVRAVFIAGLFLGVLAHANGAEDDGVLAAIRSESKDRAEKALRSLEEQRAQLITALCERLRQILGVKGSEQEKRYIILALGKLKAVEALDILVAHLGYSMIGTREGMFANDPPPPLKDEFPAVAALLEIGPCATDALLQAVAEGRLEGQGARNVGWLVVTWFGGDRGKARLQSFASTLATKEQKDRVLSPALLVYYK